MIYRVLEPFQLYERLGSTDTSNTYVGRSQALCPVYLETQAEPRELLLECPAGLFRVGPDGLYAELLLQLDERHLFEGGAAPRQIVPVALVRREPEAVLPPFRRRGLRQFSFHQPERHGVCRWVGRGPVLVYTRLSRDYRVRLSRDPLELGLERTVEERRLVTAAGTVPELLREALRGLGFSDDRVYNGASLEAQFPWGVALVPGESLRFEWVADFIDYCLEVIPEPVS